MKNQYVGPDCLKIRSGFDRKEGVVFFRVLDTPMPTMIILSHLELSRIDLPKLNSSILMEIVTIPVGQVDKFNFYMHYHIKAWLFVKNFFKLVSLSLLVSY